MNRKQILSSMVAVAVILASVIWFVNAMGDNLYYRRIDGIDTISICNPDNIDSCITMMDRNLWATETWIFACEEYSCQEWRLKYEYEYWDSLEDCIDNMWEEDCYFHYESADECISDGNTLYYCLWRRAYWDIFNSEADCDNRAESLYNQCMSQQTWMLWNHYQWWNNHGFLPWENGSSDFPWWEEIIHSSNRSCNSSLVLSFWYNVDVFVNYFPDWCNPKNDNLWWWSWDSETNHRWWDNRYATAEDRQWPCPQWYHVPTIWERNQVVDNWVDGNKDLFVHRSLISYDGEWLLNLQNCAERSNYSCYDENDNEVDCDSEDAIYLDCPYYDETLWLKFQEDFQIPFAGYRSNDAYVLGIWSSALLYSSSPYDNQAHAFYLDPTSIFVNNPLDRANGASVRCFRDTTVIKPTITMKKSWIKTWRTYIWDTQYIWFPQWTIIINTVEQVDWKPVLWSVNIDFWTSATAHFSRLVSVNIPVDWDGQVVVQVKVKHWWLDEYNYDWLTTNIDASCSSGEVLNPDDRYNWEAINVVDGYATIYTCSASSFIALRWENTWEPQVIVNIAEFNWWQNTCTWSNYIFENIQADKTSRDYELTWVFECAFGDSQSKTVTLQLSGNLVADGDRVISGSNVQMKNSEWTSSPVWLKFANTLISTWRALTATQTLFQKTGSMIWIASWVVSVQITVPAWTPDGTYNWTLVLTY